MSKIVHFEKIDILKMLFFGQIEIPNSKELRFLLFSQKCILKWSIVAVTDFGTFCD